MAFANIGESKQVRIGFMGVYQNLLVNPKDDTWNLIFESVSQFDKPPTVEIGTNSISF